MKRRVRITKLPNYEHGSEVKLGGGDTQGGYPVDPAEHSVPDLNVSSFVSPVPRDQANIEAEKGETIISPMGDDARTRSLPKTFIVGGKKHHSGGTPLNVPDGTFVFSDHLKETNQDIHKMFKKKPKKSGYTYADLSKPYMLNKDIKHLIDDNSDKISQTTAKMNIQNKVEKLSLLALLQESKKGFGDGDEFDMPEIGMVHMERTGMDLSQAIQPYIDAITPQAQPQMARLGGPVIMKNGGGVKGLKPGHRVDRATGEIIDKNGRVVGYITSAGAVDAKKTKKASIPKDATVIRRKDYASEAEYVAARDLAFNESEGKAIYTQDSNGVYRKVGKRAKTFDPYEGDLLETTFNNNQNVADQYYYLQQKFNTPEAKKALQERAIAAYQNKANVRGMSQSQVDAAVKRLKDNPDLAYEQFLDMQQRNMSLLAHSPEIGSVATYQNAPGKSGVSNKDFNEAYEKIGLTAPSKEDAALQQAIYIGYRDLLKDAEAGNITDEKLLSSLESFNITQVGQSDDAITGDKPGSISMIDGIYTNTTAGQIAGISADPEIFEQDLEAEKDSDIDIKGIRGAKDQTPYGWRAPDVKRLWSAQRNLTSDVKEQPWAKIPDYYLPNVYLDSPDQRAFNERGRIKALEDTLSTYGTPGVLASSASALSGAGQIGQYISQVGRENKQRVNQHSANLAGIMNKAATERAGLATSVHDKRALVNEKHRAFKREAQKQWDDAFDWGYNKAAELAMINARTPNYNVEPWSGRLTFTGSGDLQPTDPAQTKTMMDRVAEYKNLYPHIEDSVILQAVKGEMGMQEQYPSHLNYGSAAMPS
jgi:hypothetical protein